MKKYLLIVFLIISVPTFMYAQNNKYTRININLLSELTKQSSTPTYIIFWIPNCSKASEQIQSFSMNYQQYKNNLNYVFIAITNNEKLIANLTDENTSQLPIYILDTTYSKGLEENYNTFSSIFCKRNNIKDGVLGSMIIDNSNNLYYRSDMNDLTLKKTKKLLQKIYAESRKA